MRTFLIFLFVAVVSLFIYNPEMDDFRSYIAQEADKQNMQQEQSALANRMFNTDTTSIDQKPVGYSTERNNFLIFSTYRIYIDNDFQHKEVGSYLGIATMFFQLGESEAMTAHAAQP